MLGLDVGTSRTKAVMVDRDGRQVGAASVPTPFARRGDAVEMSVADLRAAVQTVLERLGRGRGTVAAVGVAGVAESGAPLDNRRRPLAPIIAWSDPRGAETVDLLERHFGDGLSRLIGQRIRAVSSVAKLGWLLDHGVTGVRRWLGVPELCVFLLTTAEVTEHSLAARTGCYDVARLRYLPEVAERVGFDIAVFPPVASAGRAMGLVSAAASAWSGLPEGATVTLAGHDHLAGVDGCGAADGDLVNSVGTAETVIGSHAALPDIERALALRAAMTVRPGPNGWATLASAARAGVVLDQVAGALGQPPDVLDELAQDAEAADAASVLADVERGQAPRLPPGLPGAVWKGALQALAERTADAADRASALTGSPGRMVVFGGGSRSRPWLEAKASAVAVPVWRSTVAEAVARGAALRAGMAAGWWPSPSDAPRAPLEPVHSSA